MTAHVLGGQRLLEPEKLQRLEQLGPSFGLRVGH